MTSLADCCYTVLLLAETLETRFDVNYSHRKWLRFSEKGGIGRAVSLADKLAESGTDELMFMEGEPITVLMQLSEYSTHRHVLTLIHAGIKARTDTLLLLLLTFAYSDDGRYLGSCEGVVGIFQ